MNVRDKDLLARRCLLNLDQVVGMWKRKEWSNLAVIVAYARKGIPVVLSKTDPYEYRRLCAGLAEYNIRGFDGFDLDTIEALAGEREHSSHQAEATATR